MTNWNNNNIDRIEGFRLEALRNRNTNTKNKKTQHVNVNSQGYSKLSSIISSEPELEPKPEPNQYDLGFYIKKK